MLSLKDRTPGSDGGSDKSDPQDASSGRDAGAEADAAPAKEGGLVGPSDAQAPRKVETLYTGPGLDGLAVAAADLYVTGAYDGGKIVFRVPKDPPRKPASFIDDLADPTTDRLRMGATDGKLYFEVTNGDLRVAEKDPQIPGGVLGKVFVDHILTPKLAVTFADRIAFVVHDGMVTELQVASDSSQTIDIAIGAKGLDLGPVALDAALTVFIKHPEGSVIRYAPNEGRTTLGTIADPAVAIALDDASVYVGVVGGRVLRLPRTGGAPEELLRGIGEVKALASTGNELLVLVEGAPGRLIGCDPTSCSASRKDLFADVEQPVGLGVDAAWIYVAERGSAAAGGRVRHIQRAAR